MANLGSGLALSDLRLSQRTPMLTSDNFLLQVKATQLLLRLLVDVLGKVVNIGPKKGTTSLWIFLGGARNGLTFFCSVREKSSFYTPGAWTCSHLPYQI